MSSISGFVFFCSLYYLPQFFQVVLGYSPIRAGVFLIPVLVSQMVASWIAVRLLFFVHLCPTQPDRFTGCGRQSHRAISRKPYLAACMTSTLTLCPPEHNSPGLRDLGHSLWLHLNHYANIAQGCPRYLHATCGDWSRPSKGVPFRLYDTNDAIYGKTLQTTTVAAQASVPRKDMSVVTAFRNVRVPFRILPYSPL